MPQTMKNQSLALTPPMGWNSWNHFRCYGLNEKAILETADSLVSSGMAEAGYQYLVVDDCWQAFTRDTGGQLLGHPERFPGGMEKLGQKIHDRGLKFGLYLSPGHKTCAMIYDRYPAKDLGSFGFEQQDADLLAGWGVDYLKYDWCKADKGKTGLQYAQAFGHMAQALTNTGRDMILSISEYGVTKPWLWAGQYGHLWRTTQDIQPTWQSIMRLTDQQHGIASYAGPGGWNDPDMLQVGNGKLTELESRAHFMLWVMLAAPLMAGNDLRSMSDGIRSLLTHPGLLAISQDPAGVQGERITRHRRIDVWEKKLSTGVAHGFLNRSSKPVPLRYTGTQILAPDDTVLATLGPQPTNVWTGNRLKARTDGGAEAITLDPREMILIRS